jgi:hypothetical protein
MVQVWGHLFQNFLWLPPNRKEKNIPKGVKGWWRDNLWPKGPLSLHHKILCQPLCVRGACPGHLWGTRKMLGECPHLGYGGHEHQHDLTLTLNRNHGSHSLAPQRQSPKARWNPNKILSRICEWGRPHATTNFQGHVNIGIDIGIHQQGQDHLDFEVRGPLKTGELKPNHTFGKHMQDPCKKFSHKDPRIPSSRDQTKPNWLRRRKKHSRQ